MNGKDKQLDTLLWALETNKKNLKEREKISSEGKIKQFATEIRIKQGLLFSSQQHNVQ